jgi:hypothetical protein
MPAPKLGRGGRRARQIGGEILPTHIYYSEGKVTVWCPSSSARSSGAIFGTWCMVPQPFAVGGNRSYPEFSVITSAPQYPGYWAPTCMFIEKMNFGNH